MGRALTAFVAAGLLVAGTAGAVAAEGGKRGGVLTMYHRDSPASASIHEEATFSTNVPFMGLYNNLVIYDQHKPQNTLDTIVPDLATSWSWNPDQTQLTFKLRSGVKWHDGKPFSAKDVKCTFDTLMGKSKDLLRKNPRQAWYSNVVDVSVKGDDEATFQLKRPQPSLLPVQAGEEPVAARQLGADRAQRDHVAYTAVTDRRNDCLTAPVLVGVVIGQGRVERGERVDRIGASESLCQEVDVADIAGGGLGSERIELGELFG